MIKPKITKYNWFMYKELLGCEIYRKIKLKLLDKHEITLTESTFNYWEKDEVFVIEYIEPDKYKSCFQLLGMYFSQIRKIYVYVGDVKYKFKYDTEKERDKLLELFTSYFKEG